MNINKAISETDFLVHNTFERERKIEWLSVADGIIQKTIIDTHEGGTSDFHGYDVNTPGETELIVPAPWDECYIHWLASKIHYANGEYTKYNNAVAMYDNMVQKFKNEYKKTHASKSSGRFRF